MQVGSAANHFTFTAFTWVFVFVNIIMIFKKKKFKIGCLPAKCMDQSSMGTR